MHRLAVIDRGRHALGLQRGGKAVAVGAFRQADRVLRPDRGIAGRQAWHRDDVAQATRIALGDPVAGGDLVVEDLQLLDQDRGLHGVEPAGQAEPDVVVFVDALPVHADAAQRRRELVVIGEDRAAVAEAAERLCREEAGRGGESEGAELAALVAGAETLSGVIEHEQALGPRDLGDGVVIGGLAEQIDRNHRNRLEAGLARGRDAALERVRAHVEGGLVDVDIDRRRAGARHRRGCRDEGEGRTQHGIAGSDILRHHHHQDRVGAAGTADDMLGAGIGRKLLLELEHLGPVDELAMIEHALDGGIERGAEPAALRGDVDEGNRFGAQMLVHGLVLGALLVLSGRHGQGSAGDTARPLEGGRFGRGP